MIRDSLETEPERSLRSDRLTSAAEPTTRPPADSPRPAAAAPSTAPPRKAAATPPAARHRGHGGKVLIATVLLGGCGLTAAALSTLTGGSWTSTDQPLVYYTVTRGDLPIVVTERGNLESQDAVSVRCEVDDIEGDGIHGTPILSIVPNGASVEKDELLVELDVANHTERLDRQILNTERARSEQVQAQVKYDNRKSQNETLREEAELAVQLADLALKQFEDDNGGTFQLDLQDVELQIQEAQAGKLIEETNLEGVEQLYKLGYRSRGELDQARLSALKAERQLATALSRKRELVTYRYQKTKLELGGALASAQRALEQVKRDNESLLAQAAAKLEAENEALKKEEERLARYREQISKSKIYAPQAGMVAYSISKHRWYSQEIREGAPVRPRQLILTLPNLKKMQVKTSVHESVLDQVRSGLNVTIRVDAIPDRTYAGSIQSVAVLPDQSSWMSSDTKVYETVITIDEDVHQLKPGMTAVAEIHVDRLIAVLSVPVQAIVQIENESWCYVDGAGGVERRIVELGRTNDKFVEIRSGVDVGDRVVLNPMAIVDEAERSEVPISPDGGASEKRAAEGGAGRQPTDAAADPAPAA